MGARHFAPVVGRFPAGGGVENPADALDLLGDHDRIRPIFGAFEKHVFEEMGHPLDGGFS